MKSALSMLVLGLLLSAVRGKALQDRGKDCDISSVQSGRWCKKCYKLLEKADLNKDGKCAGCGERAFECEVCVKKHYVASCDEAGCAKIDQAKQGKCKCGKPLKEAAQPDKARIYYQCGDCGNQADTAGQMTHQKACKKKECKKVCSKSGFSPHVAQP